MVYIPGNSSWLFQVTGTEIEGWDYEGVDVQYPWEAVAKRVHPAIAIDIKSFYMDVFVVTNEQYALFLAESGYEPKDKHNFLRDW